MSRLDTLADAVNMDEKQENKYNEKVCACMYMYVCYVFVYVMSTTICKKENSSVYSSLSVCIGFVLHSLQICSVFYPTDAALASAFFVGQRFLANEDFQPVG